MFSRFRFPLFILFIALIGRASAAETPAADFYTAIRNNDLQTLNRLAAGKSGGVDERGRTPLMYAAGVGSLEAMRVLLSGGADVNAADTFGVTALMFGSRDISKVRLLLDAGARPNDKSKQNQTALLIAAGNSGAIDTVRLLVAKGADPKITGAAGRNGLIVAADANDLAMVQFFLDQGVSVNSVDNTDKSGHTALMAAAAQCNAAMVKLILQNGANVNLATTDAGVVKNGPLALKGRTALMMAAPYGSPEIVRMLLNAHASVNARDVSGMTPLIFAVASENQDPEVVNLLLAVGADTKARSTEGETALDWARKYGSPAILKLLNDGAGDGAGKAGGVTAKFEPVKIPQTVELRSMIQSSVSLLQRSSTEVTTNGGCVNCHHQVFTGLALAASREKSIPIDELAAADQSKAMVVSLRGRENTTVQRMDSGGGLDTAIYTLSALQAGKYPPDATTDAMVAYVMSRQFSDGRWPREEASRSPIQDGDINRVALAVSAMQAFTSPALKAEVNEHVEKARRWLLTAVPVTTDDRAALLLGLRRSGAPQSNVQGAAKALLGFQGKDGGWGGNKSLSSDAYATSEALCALFDAGTLTAQDAAYQRGIQFLIGIRAKDGSWQVRSRAPKFQPYFESGFPYGHDQWVSAAATARAVVAISRYIP